MKTIKENIMFIIAYNDLFVYKVFGDFSFLTEDEKDSITMYLALEFVKDYNMLNKCITIV